MLAAEVAIEREVTVVDVEVLPPAGSQVKRTLPHVVVEVSLVVHWEADVVNKLLLQLRLTQSVPVGVRRCCTYAGGEHVVEPVKNKWDIHLQCCRIFPPADADGVYLIFVGYAGGNQLSTIAIRQRKLRKKALVSHRCRVRAGADVAIVLVAKTDLRGVQQVVRKPEDTGFDGTDIIEITVVYR